MVDGDTIDCGGQRVRLLLVDTPERGEKGYYEAKAWLEGRVQGQVVRLERDISDEGIYGRKLRYVWLDGELINEELVDEGYAEVALYPPDDKYYERITDGQ